MLLLDKTFVLYYCLLRYCKLAHQ